MNKWKIISLVSVLSAILMCFYTFNNQTIVNVYQQEESRRSGILSHYFQLNSEVMGTKIDDIKCESENGKLYLSEMVKDRPILIYRYTEASCQSCIEKDIKIMDDFFSSSDSTIVAVLNSYYDRRQYLVDRNKMKQPLYNISKDTLNLDLEKQGLPYCFILHPNMKISNVFLPDKNNTEYTHQYFKAVKHFLKNE